MTARILNSFLALLLAGGLYGCSSSGPAVADNDPSRVICRTDPDTGSRLPKRICKTAEEWDEIAELNLEARRNLRRDSTEPPPVIEGGRVR